MKIIHIFIFCITLGQGFAQQHFIKYIDFDSLGQSSQQIVKQGDHYLLGYYQTCKSDLASQCSGVIRMDEEGNLISKNWLEKFSNNPNSMLITDDKLLLTGEDYNIDDLEEDDYVVHQLDLQTLDSIESYVVEDVTKKFVNMFQLANTYWNDKIAIAGSGSLGINTGNRCLIYVLNKDKWRV